MVQSLVPTEPRTRGRPAQPRALVAVMLIVGGGFLTQLLSAVTGALSARMLGVEGRGEVVLVASLAAMTSQLTLGGSLTNAITRQLAIRNVTARDGLRHFVPRWSAWALLASAVAGGYFLFVERDAGGTAKYALAVGVVIMALQAIASRLLIGAMLGEGANLVHIALTGVLPQAATTVVLALAYGLGVRWNPVELTGVVVVCLVGVLLLRLRVLAKPIGRRDDRLDGRELNALARRTHLGSVGPLNGLGLDSTLVGTFMGSELLGLYSAANALSSLTGILGGCLAMVVLPRVTVAQHDPVAERQLVRRWLAASAVLIVVVVVLVELGAGAIIRFGFGADFVAATTCARWLVAASGVLDFRRVLIAVLQGRDYGGVASVIELALLPLMIAGIAVASVHHSIVGVGVTMAVVAVLACGALAVAVARSAPGRRDLPGRRYVPAHAAARRASVRT